MPFSSTLVAESAVRDLARWVRCAKSKKCFYILAKTSARSKTKRLRSNLPRSTTISQFLSSQISTATRQAKSSLASYRLSYGRWSATKSLVRAFASFHCSLWKFGLAARDTGTASRYFDLDSNPRPPGSTGQVFAEPRSRIPRPLH